MSVNPMSLRGRTILITGGSSGIGRETAVLLSQLEARVIVSGRDTQRLEQTLSLLEGEGHRIQHFAFTDIDVVPSWIKTIVSEDGPLDGIVHSAGVADVLPVRALTAAQIHSMLDLNLGAALMLARGLRQKGCHTAAASLVLLSSTAAIRSQAGMSVYSASKAALIGASKSLAREFIADQIRVNCVAPGLVATEMAARADQQTSIGVDSLAAAHPLGVGKPRDVANAIAFLLSDAARWITGSTLVVDGGYSA